MLINQMLRNNKYSLIKNKNNKKFNKINKFQKNRKNLKMMKKILESN